MNRSQGIRKLVSACQFFGVEIRIPIIFGFFFFFQRLSDPAEWKRNTGLDKD